MFEKFFAGGVLAVCVVLLVHMALGARRQRAVEMALRRSFAAVRRAARRAMHWRSTRRQAARAAEEAIRRASDGQWDGNVYKPKFRPPRKPH
jgi:uncharacterized protein HemY